MAPEEGEEKEAAERGACNAIVLVIIVVGRGQQQVQEAAHNLRGANMEGCLPIARFRYEDTRDKYHEWLAHVWRSHLRIAVSPRHEREERGELLRYVVYDWAY